jgi:LacI family gluconate utilization system Gnt-I transcriptional repressor
MTDVAKLAGVSPMSVSNSFKYPDRVSAEIRNLVFEASAKLGYLPNTLAGTLASGRTHVVGAIVPSLRNSNFAGMIQGLEETLHARGYELMLAVADDMERERRAVQAFLGRRLDGIILTGVDHSHDVEKLLRRSETPVVQTWSLNGPFIDMGVGFSLYDAAFEMTQLMIQRGYRRIGFAGYAPPNNARFAERQRGFQEAMQQAGLASDLLYFGQETLGFAAGRLALEQLLERDAKLDALFCATDVLAVGAMFECARRGWPIPERLGVAGYGDYEIAAEIRPALTTVRTPGHAMGAAAAHLLFDRNEGTQIERVIDVGYEIIVRESI